MKSSIRDLALDALHRKNSGKEDHTSCFIFNEAAERLRNCGADALSVIEGLIRDVVVPAMVEYRKRTGVPEWGSLFRDGPPFADLSGFLGAYLIICARCDPARAVAFLKQIPTPVVTEAVSNIGTYFNPHNLISDTPLPAEFVVYLNELMASDIGEFRAVAQHVSRRLRLSVTE